MSLLPPELAHEADERGWCVTIVFDAVTSAPAAMVLPPGFSEIYPDAQALQRQVILAAKMGDVLAIRVLQAIVAFNMKAKDAVQTPPRRKSRSK